MNPTHKVEAALALAEVSTIRSPEWADAVCVMLSFCAYGESTSKAALRILAAEVRRLREELGKWADEE